MSIPDKGKNHIHIDRHTNQHKHGDESLRVLPHWPGEKTAGRRGLSLLRVLHFRGATA